MSNQRGYPDRYYAPSPEYKNPTSTTLERLLRSWELLRELDTEGYRTSSADPMSTWLVAISWQDRRISRSTGRGTTCSPFVTQSTAIALSTSAEDEPVVPKLAPGNRTETLPFLFSQMANGVLSSQNPVHARIMKDYGVLPSDNEWPRPIIFFNIGSAVELVDLRRGDAVHIDWMSGGGHTVFVWDVHLNERGEVDAFQYLSSNGRIPNGGTGGGVSVGGTGSGAGGFIEQQPGGRPRYRAARQPLFADHPEYVRVGSWVTWDPRVAASGLRNLRGGVARSATLVKRAKAARLHGVDTTSVPLYAMGQDTPGPMILPLPTREPAPESPEAQARDLQRRLKLLYRIGWIDRDPGPVDGRPGPATYAAVSAFQKRYALTVDGKPGPLTRDKLVKVSRSALDSPQGRALLEEIQPGAAASFSSVEPRTLLYFRSGIASAGGELALILSCSGGIAEDVTGLPIELFDVETQAVIVPTVSGSWQYEDGTRAVRTISIPKEAAGRCVAARIADADLVTRAPLRVLESGHGSA